MINTDGYIEKGVVLSMQDGIMPSEILAFEKGLDKSKLVKKRVTDSRGHSTSRWVRANPTEQKESGKNPRLDSLNQELKGLKSEFEKVSSSHSKGLANSQDVNFAAGKMRDLEVKISNIQAADREVAKDGGTSALASLNKELDGINSEIEKVTASYNRGGATDNDKNFVFNKKKMVEDKIFQIEYAALMKNKA